MWVKRHSFGFKSLAERQENDGAVLKRQNFVCTNFIEWFLSSGFMDTDSQNAKVTVHLRLLLILPHLCRIFPLAKFGQMLDVEFSQRSLIPLCTAFSDYLIRQL
jgi:hypothetical protein